MRLHLKKTKAKSPLSANIKQKALSWTAAHRQVCGGSLGLPLLVGRLEEVSSLCPCRRSTCFGRQLELSARPLPLLTPPGKSPGHLGSRDSRGEGWKVGDSQRWAKPKRYPRLLPDPVPWVHVNGEFVCGSFRPDIT